MTESHTFMPGDDDPLAGIQANPHSAAPAAVPPSPPSAPFGAAPAYGDHRSAPYTFNPGVWPSAYEQVQGKGVSNGLNKYGHYSLFFGILSLVASVLVFVGFGLPWLNLVLGVVGVFFGVRGFRAGQRRLATNGGAALAGAIIGGLGVLGTIAYFVLVAVVVAAYLSGTGGF